MRKYSFKESALVNIVESVVDIIFQILMMFIVKQKEKYYIYGRSTLIYLFFGSKIIGDIILICFSIVIYSKTNMDYSMYTIFANLCEIYKYLFSKSIPCAFFILTSTISTVLLFKHKIQKQIKIATFIITIFIMVIEIISVTLSTVEALHTHHKNCSNGAEQVVSIFDIILTILMIVIFVVYNIFLSKRKNDQLFQECLSRVQMNARYEMGVFLIYIISTSVYQLGGLFIDFDLVNYQGFVVLEVLYIAYFDIVFSLVFIPPRRFLYQFLDQKVEMLSTTQMLSELPDEIGVAAEDEVSF